MMQTTEEQLTIIDRVGWDRIRVNKSYCRFCSYYHYPMGCKLNRLSTERNGDRCRSFNPRRGVGTVERLDDFYARKEAKLKRKKLRSLL